MALNVVQSSFMSAAAAPPLGAPQGHPAVFLDKDGALLENTGSNVDPALMRLTPVARVALRVLGSLNYRLIVVGNQTGAGFGSSRARALAAVEARLAGLFAECGAVLSGFFSCPHSPEEGRRLACVCRKPMPGLLHRAAMELDVGSAGSWMVGDILDDIEAGRRAGFRTILLSSGSEMRWQPGPYRSPHYLVHGLDDAARVIAASRYVPSRYEPVNA